MPARLDLSIAQTTRQPKIFFVVCPAEGFRLDVLYFEDAEDVFL